MPAPPSDTLRTEAWSVDVNERQRGVDWESRRCPLQIEIEPLALFVTFWDTCSIQMYRIFFTPIQVRKTANPPCRERRFRRFHPKPLHERLRHGPGSPRVRRAAPGHIPFLFRIRPHARPLRICRRAAGAIRGSPSGRQPTKNGTAQTPQIGLSYDEALRCRHAGGPDAEAPEPLGGSRVSRISSAVRADLKVPSP